MSLITKFRNLQVSKSVYLAVLGALVCVVYLSVSQFKPKELVPPRKPAQKPYQEVISGVGIVESKNKNIEIAPFFGGIVKSVYVQEGDRVKAGQVLYQLNSDTLRAQYVSQEAAVRSAAANLAKLKAGPRPEDVPPLEAVVRDKEAKYADQVQYLQRLESVSDPRSVSQNEIANKRFELAAAKADLEKAKAELTKTKAGTWKYDIQVAEQDYQAAVDRLREIQTSLKQSFITAPLDAVVLQVNVKSGEYISPTSNEASLIIGENTKLQVRVDIDEVNASRVKPNMQAYAFVKGHSELKFPLQFVRIEPYMVPKKNLSGSSSERTDTRVLQVIYEFAPPPFPVYVGQQLEVYLDNGKEQS